MTIRHDIVSLRYTIYTFLSIKLYYTFLQTKYDASWIIYTNTKTIKMKYNIITDLIKNHCEEIYHVEDCENFLEENELDLKWFKNDDHIIFSNLCDDYSEMKTILKNNNIDFNEYEDYTNLNYIVL